MLNNQERLSQLLAAEQDRPRATFPSDRRPALLALTRARDAWYLAAERSPAQPESREDQARWYGWGWNRALQLGFDAGDTPSRPPDPMGDALARWADEVIQECSRLGEAELVLAQAETGYLQL
jgi:hypothetical protein